jgi:hypothetical protein
VPTCFTSAEGPICAPGPIIGSRPLILYSRYEFITVSLLERLRYNTARPLEGGSVNRCFKTPVIIANTEYRKGLSRKLGCGKIAALFLHIPTSRGDRLASPPDFSASRFSRNFSDL